MKTIELEPNQEPAKTETALVVRQQSTAVGEAMSLEELRTNLEFIKEVMKSVMVEGQDYGKIPGCGDKPSLLQPGAQKLCMTFQLSDDVKQEVIKDFPGNHREYAFIIRLTSKTGRTWEGVGTCSTLESKYRFRKAERRCPKCGKHTIIQGRAEYGGGWLCFAKKGGCGAKFPEDDESITSQPGGTVEHENPPDFWNTVRKMAFKRAQVHASIIATNTSELWSQDLEDMDHDRPEASRGSKKAQDRPKNGTTQPTSQAKPASPTPKSAPAIPFPTEESRTKMIGMLKANQGEDNRGIVTEFFQKCGVLLPNEDLEDLPLRFVPATQKQMRLLGGAIADFGNGVERANLPYVAHPDPAPVKPKNVKKDSARELFRDEEHQPEDQQTTLLKTGISHPTEQVNAELDPEDQWFMDFIVPIPPKGMRKAEYDKCPDTIGSLYAMRHGDDDESHMARQRLWGFVTHFEPKPWVKRDGTEVPPSANDKKFREALDAFAEFFEKNHPDEKL